MDAPKAKPRAVFPFRKTATITADISGKNMAILNIPGISPNTPNYIPNIYIAAIIIIPTDVTVAYI